MFSTQEGQRAASQAIRSASQAYQAIERARNAANADESSNVYSDDHLAKLRETQALSTRRNVESTIESAESSIVSSKQQTTAKLERLRRVSESEVAASSALLNPLLPDDPVRDYQRVIDVYQKLENKADRFVLEGLLERIGKLVPDVGAFNALYSEARRKLEPTLPVEERDALRALAELESTLAYLSSVRAVCDAALESVRDPKQPAMRNLTNFTRVTMFEREHTNDGVELVGRAVGRAPIGAS